jgi:hypothetical protein
MDVQQELELGRIIRLRDSNLQRTRHEGRSGSLVCYLAWMGQFHSWDFLLRSCMDRYLIPGLPVTACFQYGVMLAFVPWFVTRNVDFAGSSETDHVQDIPS